MEIEDQSHTYELWHRLRHTFSIIVRLIGYFNEETTGTWCWRGKTRNLRAREYDPTFFGTYFQIVVLNFVTEAKSGVGFKNTPSYWVISKVLSVFMSLL